MTDLVKVDNLSVTDLVNVHDLWADVVLCGDRLLVRISAPVETHHIRI